MWERCIGSVFGVDILFSLLTEEELYTIFQCYARYLSDIDL